MNITKTDLKTNVYVLVSDKDNLILTDFKLPLYWNRNIANKDALIFDAKVKKLKLSELKRVMS